MPDGADSGSAGGDAGAAEGEVDDEAFEDDELSAEPWLSVSMLLEAEAED